MSIAERIVNERKRLGLSQAEFASRAGVSLSSQKRYEKGERDPDSSYLEAIESIGVDRFYLNIGSRIDDYQSDRYTATEWFMSEICDALALRQEDFTDAIDKLEPAVKKMVETDSTLEIEALAKSLVSSIFAKSPLLDPRVSETIAELHISDYAAIVEKFEAAQIGLGLVISPQKKAQSVAMLWRVLLSGGKVDPIMLEEAIKLAAG